jgi:ATP-dependent RNA helicase MSS116
MLFSSDVTARGMDFPNVTHVIQVGVPASTETYIHRIGRTGRAGKEGEGWLILNKMELPEARQRLRRLPLQPDDTIQSGKVNMTAPAQLPAQVAAVLTDIGNAVKAVDPMLLSAVYKAYIGVYQWIPSRQALIDNLAQLSRYGWGLSTPPKIAPGLAGKMRLTGLRNVNIGVEEAPRGGFGSGRFGGGRQGGFGGRGGGRYGGGYSNGGRRDTPPPAW